MGGVGFAVLASGGHELAGVSFVAASVFPGLDVFFMIFGKKYYLKAHQGPTHSLLLSPIFALLLCFPVFYYQEPLHVRDFLLKLPAMPGRCWFLFCTHGSVMGNIFRSMAGKLFHNDACAR